MKNRDTPTSDDAYVYEILLKSFERIRSIKRDQRKFTDRDHTIIRASFDGRIKR